MQSSAKSSEKEGENLKKITVNLDIDPLLFTALEHYSKEKGVDLETILTASAAQILTKEVAKLAMKYIPSTVRKFIDSQSEQGQSAVEKAAPPAPAIDLIYNHTDFPIENDS